MTASSQIVFALHTASPKYTPKMRQTFGWLLRLAIQQSHRNPRPHRPLYFLFLCRSIRHLKRWAKVLPHAFRPCASPLQCPSHRRHHQSVGCHVFLSNGGHLRLVLRPSPNFSLGAISGPITRGPNAARASPGTRHLPKAHWEPRRCDSGPCRMLPWRLMAKPLGVGRCSDSSSCGV